MHSNCNGIAVVGSVLWTCMVWMRQKQVYGLENVKHSDFVSLLSTTFIGVKILAGPLNDFITHFFALVLCSLFVATPFLLFCTCTNFVWSCYLLCHCYRLLRSHFRSFHSHWLITRFLSHYHLLNFFHYQPYHWLSHHCRRVRHHISLRPPSLALNIPHILNGEPSFGHSMAICK